MLLPRRMAQQQLGPVSEQSAPPLVLAGRCHFWQCCGTAATKLLSLALPLPSMRTPFPPCVPRWPLPQHLWRSFVGTRRSVTVSLLLHWLVRRLPVPTTPLPPLVRVLLPPTPPALPTPPAPAPYSTGRHIRTAFDLNSPCSRMHVVCSTFLRIPLCVSPRYCACATINTNQACKLVQMPGCKAVRLARRAHEQEGLPQFHWRQQSCSLRLAGCE